MKPLSIAIVTVGAAYVAAVVLHNDLIALTFAVCGSAICFYAAIFGKE